MISIHIDPIISIFFTVLAFVLGAVFGSFLNCAAYRYVHNEKVSKGRSHCPTCGHELGFWDLFPFFSWIFLGGKCRYCKTKISIRYPLTELAFALITVACMWKYDLTIECLRNWGFFCCLFLLTLTDLEDYVIPDRCHIISILVWAAACPFLFYKLGEWQGVITHVACGLGLAVIIYIVSIIVSKVVGKDALGGGDVKLYGVAGLYLGIAGSMFMILLSCLIGALFFVVNGKKRSKAAADENSTEQNDDNHDDGLPNAPFIAFGPSIAIATFLIMVFGDPLINWYLSLFVIH